MTTVVIGHMNPDTDSIVSAIACSKLLRARGWDATPAMQGAPSPETAFVIERFQLETPEILTDVAGRDVYLVDYSDLAQAPAGMREANLKGIVDHHKLGDVTSSEPLEITVWPVGCTSTILKRLYDQFHIEIEKNIAGAMLCAILSDTVIFKSPTTTPIDIKVANELAEIAGVENLEALGMELFTAKSAVKGCTPEALIHRDYKDFNMNGHKVGIGQLELVSLELLADREAELLAKLHEIKADGRHTAMLLLTDIMQEGSRLLLASDDPAMVAHAFEATYAGEPVWLPGVMSRKKQVVPRLEAAFKAI